ncbi:MAG: sugar transferase [Clostridia bacterium]|nr:sugar transferase [Clostridia bacterium]
MMYGVLKRFFDIILSLVAIIVFSWLLIIIAIAIVVEDKGNILFKQKRIGKNKKEFYIYKFRTMKVSTPKDVPTHLLDNPESYITKIGGFLRKTSLDELPQLFNILKGDMSIVGPRPALWNQFDLIDLRDKNGSNSVRPGLTGWAQVNGRDELPIDVKAGFDGEYIKKMSIVFDIKIILMTVVSVFTSKGVREGRNESSNNR